MGRFAGGLDTHRSLSTWVGGYRHGLAGARLEEAGLVVSDHRALGLQQVEAGTGGPGSRQGKREGERLRPWREVEGQRIRRAARATIWVRVSALSLGHFLCEMMALCIPSEGSTGRRMDDKRCSQKHGQEGQRAAGVAGCPVPSGDVVGCREDSSLCDSSLCAWGQEGVARGGR